jgi:hypothetical protein
VKVTNGENIKTSKRALVPLAKEPLTKAKVGHIFDGLQSGSLISIGQLCDDDCVVLFTKYNVKIYKDGKVIIVGQRKYYPKRWSHVAFETSDQFFDWTENMDIDYIEVTGPPSCTAWKDQLTKEEVVEFVKRLPMHLTFMAGFVAEGNSESTCYYCPCSKLSQQWREATGIKATSASFSCTACSLSCVLQPWQGQDEECPTWTDTYLHWLVHSL